MSDDTAQRTPLIALTELNGAPVPTVIVDYVSQLYNLTRPISQRNAPFLFVFAGDFQEGTILIGDKFVLRKLPPRLGA